MTDSDLYNSDELVAPEWLNTEFFETVLHSARNGDLKKVLKFDIGPATGKGDHFASVMFRAIVTFENLNNEKDTISLIIKIMPEIDGYKKEALTESTIFETEIEMFRDIIPKFERMLKSIGDETRLSAKMLYYSLSPKKIIVLEDITKLGFTTTGKRMCTLEETKMALDMVAKWHACSYIINQESNGSLEKFNNGLYNLPGMQMRELFSRSIGIVKELAEEIPKLQKYLNKIKQIDPIVTADHLINIYDISKRKGRVNILCHGDFHGKNLMFQFDPKTELAKTVILVDFQLCVWGSMAIDVLYFIYMAIDGKTREAHHEELISYLYEKFEENLKKLNYKGKIPTFDDLKKDLILLSRIETFISFSFLPFTISLLEQKNIDPNDLMSSEEIQKSLYKSEMYINDLCNILERLTENGSIDNLINGVE